MRLRTRTALTLLPVLLPLLALGLWEYRSQGRQLEQQLQRTVTLAVETAALQVNAFLRVKHQEFELLAGNLMQCSDAYALQENSARASMALQRASGFSALLIADGEGRVQHTLFSARSGSGQRPLTPLGSGQAPSASALTELQQRYANWRVQRTALREHLAALQAQAAELNSQGAQHSGPYRALQQQINTAAAQISLPPVLVSLGGRALAQQMGLPFSGDTLLLSLLLERCDQHGSELVTALLDWTQIEDVLQRVHNSLGQRGYEKVDVAIRNRQSGELLTSTRFLPLQAGRVAPDLAGALAAAPIIDHHVLQLMSDRALLGGDFWTDPDYDAALRDHSSLGLLAYISAEELESRLNKVLQRLLLLSLTALVLLVGLILLLVRNIVRPVKELERCMEAVSHGESGHRLSLKRKDELGHLAQAFNEMSARLKEKEEALYQLASTDPLTGLLNRRAFADSARRELERAGRMHYPLALLMFDLDHFKQVNDNHGHSVGDLVLCQFADSLRHILRGMDLIGRIGGEEFVVLLAASDMAAAVETAERIRQPISQQPFGPPDGPQLSITVSGGLCRWYPDQSLDEALRQVDLALYSAKADGRNRIVAGAERPDDSPGE